MNSRLNTKCLRNFHFFVLFPFKKRTPAPIFSLTYIIYAHSFKKTITQYRVHFLHDVKKLRDCLNNIPVENFVVVAIILIR